MEERISMEGAAIFVLLFASLHIHNIYTAEVHTISQAQFLTDGDTLVSPAGIFELGFFRPGGSENRHIGIWYKKISVRTVVWVANRDLPLAGASSGVLRIAHPGTLILVNNTSDMIWSSNTTTPSSNAVAKLLDTGNLVVTDENQEKVLWQSFDYPTDTLLPGMKFGKDFLTGKEWYLSSWTSSQDPAPGEFTWSYDTRGYP